MRPDPFQASTANNQQKASGVKGNASLTWWLQGTRLRVTLMQDSHTIDIH